MAHLHPPALPEYVRSDPARSAESTIYDRLAQTLSDEYTVIYSVNWLSKDGEGRPRIGEADFCMLHDRAGLLVVEVKGGKIERDGTNGQWTSVDRAGHRHDIKNPAQQARRSMYALRDKIREFANNRGYAPKLGYAVALPHCPIPQDTNLGPDLPREVVIGAEDLGWLDRKIKSVFSYWNDKTAGGSVVSPAFAERIVEALSPTLSLKAPLSARLREVDTEILRLTELQQRTFEMLRKATRLAVSGGAGTGKTALALERAKQCAANGFRTLLTCFNRPLAEDLSRSAAGIEQLTVSTFHHLCETTAKAAGLEVPYYPGGAPATLYNQTLPDLFLKALARDPSLQFDAIIVDEGQDFHADWLAGLELALTARKDGLFYVFYDGAQAIYQRAFRLPEGLVPILLNVNLRNTQQIHEVAARFCDATDLTCDGPPGQPVELIGASDATTARKALSKVLHRLIREENVAHDDIAILTGRAVERSILADTKTVGAFKVRRADDVGSDAVLVESIYRFKGLERPVIILVDLDKRLEDDPSLIYVGITRARGHLIVIGSAQVLARMRGHGPQA